MDAVLISNSIVAHVEDGDETQFHSRLLAVRFKISSPTILGIEATQQKGAAATVSRAEGEKS